MKYVVQIRFDITKNNETRYHSLQRTYNLKFLKKTGTKASIYIPEHNMYFEDKLALGYLYEIETKDIKVNLGKGLSKANDFNRKINYRYNWIKANVNLRGQVNVLTTIDELLEPWERLKVLIKSNYEGEKVDGYLKVVDRQFKNENHLDKIIAQYFYFGLLFPNIPASHNSTWTNKRIVEISEYENEVFEETLVYNGINNEGLREYKIELNPLPGNDIFIDKCDGYILIPTKALLPEDAEIDITTRAEDIYTNWNFKLIKFS